MRHRRNWHRGETEQKRKRKLANRQRAMRKELRRESRELMKLEELRSRRARERSRERELARRDEIYRRYGSEAWRSCLNKMYFGSQGYAEWYAKGSTEWYGTETYVYKCRYCDGWHLTTHPMEVSVEAV